MKISTASLRSSCGWLWGIFSLVDVAGLMNLKSTAVDARNVSFCYNLGRNQHFHSPY
jgi:hypothetical protein